MSGAAPELMTGLEYRRRAVAQGFLWSGVIVALLAVPVSGLLEARELPAVQALTASLLICAALLALLWLNHRRLTLLGSMLEETLAAASGREEELDREVRERRWTETALHDEKTFNNALIDSLPGVFYVINEDGSYAQWNENLRLVTGYSEAEMTRLLPSDVVEGSDGTSVNDVIREGFSKGTVSAQLMMITRSGQRIPYLFSASRIMMQGKAHLVGIGFDTSELARARSRIQGLNAELEERLERLLALHEIDKAITGSRDLNVVLNVVVRQVTQRLAVDAASVLLFRPESQRLTFGASHGFNRAGALRNTDLQLGEGLAGLAAASRKRLFINDSARLRERFAKLELTDAGEFHSYLAVPLLAKGQLQGVLELFHGSKLEAGEDWLGFLDTLATQAAIALENGRLFENLNQSNTELLLAYDTTIEGWARALDLRDHETEGHSRRVTELTVRLARRAGVNEQALVHIRRGALLHDIGKMGVADSILLKPAKLDPQEWAEMQRHTIHAFELLEPIPFLRPALDIPYCHHERWDGHGYPRGLRGEEIPIAARAFSVVDVFDALTSDRPYRAAWSEAEALEYLRENAGTQFDPEMVKVFLAMMKGERQEAAIPKSAA